jgi:ABC-type proline/glycine betaine transport system permease subunit
MVAVIFLSGEWVNAWLLMSLAFLVAVIGVTGLGYWVLRGEARNRAADEALEATEPPSH